MRVRLLTSRVGAGFAQQYGDIIEMLDIEAGRMIETGQAEPIDDPERKAEVSEQETATVKQKRNRRK